MSDTPSDLHMLLVEPETLLRRTVSLTARTLGLANIHEAASLTAAQRLLREQPFHGAVIAIDSDPHGPSSHDLQLLDQVRFGRSASDREIPIAVMAEHVTAQLLRDLHERGIERVIVKPFRAKVLLDAFALFEMAQLSR